MLDAPCKRAPFSTILWWFFPFVFYWCLVIGQIFLYSWRLGLLFQRFSLHFVCGLVGGGFVWPSIQWTRRLNQNSSMNNNFTCSIFYVFVKFRLFSLLMLCVWINLIRRHKYNKRTEKVFRNMGNLGAFVCMPPLMEIKTQALNVMYRIRKTRLCAIHRPSFVWRFFLYMRFQFGSCHCQPFGGLSTRFHLLTFFHSLRNDVTFVWALSSCLNLTAFKWEKSK